MLAASKLSVELKNPPRDTSLVPCSGSSVLNRLERVSVQNKVLTDNLGEENQRLPVGGHKAITLVYVLNQDGGTIMPCKPAKARHLLNDGKAKVIKRDPFTIQLLWDCENNIQPVTLGIDAGYSYIGFSVTTEDRELISGEVKLRKDVSKRLTERRMYRKNRRNKLWYREPRFNNRISSKKKGCLSPSIQHRLDSHVRLVDKIKKILPISRVIVEVADFDIQKIKNPEISGVEYQQGEQLGFWNVREYTLHRDNHTCQHCKGRKKDKILQVHHINDKKEGATDRPEELLTVCKTCHGEHHKGIDIIPRKKIRNFKPETFMTTVRWKMINILGCEHTYGYITKTSRIKQGLGKSHINDAFIIAGGAKDMKRCESFNIGQTRRNNRCLQLNRKGFKPSIRRQKYNFQPHDLVKFNDKIYEVGGICNRGMYIRLKAEKDLYAKTGDVILYKYMKGMII